MTSKGSNTTHTALAHYRLLTLCPAPTDPVGQSWPRGGTGPALAHRVSVCMIHTYI